MTSPIASTYPNTMRTISHLTQTNLSKSCSQNGRDSRVTILVRQKDKLNVYSPFLFNLIPIKIPTSSTTWQSSSSKTSSESSTKKISKTSKRSQNSRHAWKKPLIMKEGTKISQGNESCWFRRYQMREAPTEPSWRARKRTFRSLIW